MVTLSRREQEVLRLIVADEPDERIAARLGISKSTVQSHVANMKQKTGAASRTGLVIIALREGLLSGRRPARYFNSKKWRARY